MHQALYRKWRPKSFDDVCGQEHITSVLEYQIKNGTPNHAYLFCGSRGTGKTTCAKILAKAVNCEAPVGGNPCGKCAACLAIENGSATDVLEMDAASNNGVENIRDIRDEVVYTPSLLKYRVYIVDEVHMLSSSAFNALLKTLEEPPAHVIFVLATTELHKLPATIVSRCQRFDFRRIAASVLAARISYIAKEEGIVLDPAAAERIARLSQGGMRDAISLLELCAGGGRQISIQTVDEMMGAVGREGVLSLVRAVACGDYDAIFATVDEANAASRDLQIFWQELIGVYRDMLVIKTTKNADRYLDLSDAEAKELAALAARFEKGTLLAHCHLLEDALFSMQGSNAVKRTVAELTLIRLCDPRLDTSGAGLVARVEKLENAMLTGRICKDEAPGATSAPTGEQKEPVPPRSRAVDAPPAKKDLQQQSSPVEKPAAPPCPTPTQKATGKGRMLTRIRGYADCVARISEENSFVGSFLVGSRAFVDEQGRVVVVLRDGFAEMMLERHNGRDILRHTLSLELKKEVRDNMFLIETASEEQEKADTVIDDILSAADGENQE